MKIGSWRIFDPVRKGFHSSVLPSEIVCDDHHSGVLRIVRVGKRSKMPVVIFIARACTSPPHVATFGVYLGKNSPHECSGKLPPWMLQTGETAVFYAAKMAVDMAQTNLLGLCRDGVVIATESGYLIDAMTTYIYNWVTHGFVNSKGRQLVNADEIQELHRMIVECEVAGIPIRFWRVQRNFNQEALRLANSALPND